MTHVVLGGRMGHSLSLNDTHCRLAGSMMSTTALVELTGSVPLMTLHGRNHSIEMGSGGTVAGCVVKTSAGPAGKRTVGAVAGGGRGTAARCSHQTQWEGGGAGEAEAVRCRQTLPSAF